MAERVIRAVLREGTLYFIANPQYEIEGHALVQYGKHCRRWLVSEAKNAYCPFCNKGVYLT